MLFNSFEFLIFVVPVIALYCALKHRQQNLLLLVASYYFYGWWNWKFLGLILLSTLVDYASGRYVERTNSETRRRTALTFSIVVNLGILALFKYFNFFLDSLAQFGPGIDAEKLHLDIVLPIGVSFYTFQTMSYTIDVYRRRLPATRRLLDFALYVAFFPQLVAGPIERASHLLPQIQRHRSLTYDHLRKGAWLILYGYFKKVVIADNMAPIADAAFSHPNQISAWEALLGSYAFAWQIYGDFSGYSAIARGIASLMGFDLMQNFRMPYFAVNPSDFWRRWHISLSTWLRDYLYLPLGGNRRGVSRTYANLLITMLLGGLWHGASGHFVAWGAYHGGLLIAHRALSHRVRGFLPAAFWQGTLVRLVRVVGYFHLTCLGWLLFRVSDLSGVWEMLGTLHHPLAPEHTARLLALAGWMFALVLPVFVIEIAQERTANMWVMKSWPAPVRLATYALLIGAIFSMGVTHGSEFLYFQF